jgi:undecaprenyl-diphosphatase
MFSALRAADHALFHRINAVWTHPWLDATMPIVTDFHHIPLVRYFLLPAAAAGWLAWKRKRGLQVLVALALLLGATDLVSHRVIKPIFHRSRPEQAGVAVVLREDMHTGLSFPSNHAVNMFAGATFLSLLYPVLTVPAFLLAALVAYSRVYVGVHFPLDVIGGAVFGAACGWFAAKAFRKYVDS